MPRHPSLVLISGATGDSDEETLYSSE